jgi:hypothetical protein
MFDLADLALAAPVNEPDSWPNTSLSKIVSGSRRSSAPRNGACGGG